MTSSFIDVDIFTHQKTRRSREARIAAAALMIAAFVSALRAAMFPWLIHTWPHTFGDVNLADIESAGWLFGSMFLALALWARKDPLPPIIAAFIIYIALSMPDVMHNDGFLQKGLISKMIVMGILARGLGAAVMNRVIQ